MRRGTTRKEGTFFRVFRKIGMLDDALLKRKSNSSLIFEEEGEGVPRTCRQFFFCSLRGKVHVNFFLPIFCLSYRTLFINLYDKISQNLSKERFDWSCFAYFMKQTKKWKWKYHFFACLRFCRVTHGLENRPPRPSCVDIVSTASDRALLSFLPLSPLMGSVSTGGDDSLRSPISPVCSFCCCFG